ncbi:hypothetical protein [Oceanispirochaeta sp.]|uniref:hypothetical protein n=1 Tax=Oceanispirochaeta sp. TaxID=2035350 RepID=UPI002623DC78|nr:hypothetical protein [Oceanispirochaeta sp.]MDA3957245.1 hypothetical protein [Oceanispirochaeta sp.]
MKKRMDKKTALKRVVVILTAAAALSVMGSCNPATGGGGADFDETLYYTKAEVDAAVQAAVDTISPVTGTASAIALAGVEWAGRTPVGFAVPNGARWVLVEIIADNGSASDYGFFIQFSSTSAGGSIVAQFELAAGAGYSQFMGLAAVPAGATTMYGWHDTVHSGATATITGANVSIQPKLWLK